MLSLLAIAILLKIYLIKDAETLSFLSGEAIEGSFELLLFFVFWADITLILISLFECVRAIMLTFKKKKIEDKLNLLTEKLDDLIVGRGIHEGFVIIPQEGTYKQKKYDEIYRKYVQTVNDFAHIEIKIKRANFHFFLLFFIRPFPEVRKRRN